VVLIDAPLTFLDKFKGGGGVRDECAGEEAKRVRAGYHCSSGTEQLARAGSRMFISQNHLTLINHINVTGRR
jgi:hypothetical protein